MVDLPQQSNMTNVCFTWFNSGDKAPLWNEEKMVYLVYQMECCPETQNLHYQGYVEFKRSTRFLTVKKLLTGDQNTAIRLASRLGTGLQASDYCQKDDTRVPGSVPVVRGTIKPDEQGKRNDLLSFKDDVKAGKRKRDIVDTHYGTLARYPKFYNTLTLMTRPKAVEAPQVILLIGEPGLGKTRYVYERHTGDDELYVAPLTNGTSWYDEYDGHPSVLLDDFSGSSSHMQLVTLLRLIDRYPVMVPTKGSHTWFQPKIIYITTNILPKDWYKWEDRGVQYLALARRFTKVILFYPPLHAEDPGHVEQDLGAWWPENSPAEAMKYYD